MLHLVFERKPDSSVYKQTALSQLTRSLISVAKKEG